MTFNVWTFLFQVINFLVLVYILRRLLYRPLREAIDRRREANAKAQADAEAARREAAALQESLDRQLAEVDGKREAVLREARERAEAERQATAAEAEAAIRRRREEVDRQLARERDEALRSLRAELVHSAVEMAGRLLSEAADSTLQRQLAARLVEELRRVSEDQRRRFREEWDDGEAAVVETAAELNGEVLRDLGGRDRIPGRAAARGLGAGAARPPGRRAAADRRACVGRLDGRTARGARGAAGGGDRAMSTLVEQVGEQVRGALGSLHWRVKAYEVGRVVGVGDGVGRVKGVASVRYGELLERSDGLMGLAFDLRPREVGVLFLDPSEHVSAGDELRATGRVASVAVGDELLGRVVDALGRPLDGGPPVRSTTRRPVEVAGAGRRRPRSRSASRCTPASR